MNNIKNVFTIKDLENISGVKAHTIRIWEKRYNLLSPQRTDTNIRNYSVESLQKLLNIVLLNNNNYKISKIAEMSSETIIVNARELVLKKGIHDETINSLKLAMFQFDTLLFNNTYAKLLVKSAFRDVFKNVFIPLLNHIGLLWQTDTLLPAHEHFISNLIAQKIQINIEKLTYSVINSEITYVLFLPENEIHELGLLYLNYELLLRGNKTIYLGQSLPLDNLKCFLDNDTKICFITQLIIQPYKDKLAGYFKQIEDMLEGTNHELYVIGERTKEFENKEFKAKVFLYLSAIDLIKEL